MTACTGSETGAARHVTRDGVAVWCAFDHLMPIGLLKPNPANPNRHPDGQIDLLSRVIRQAGWRQPVSISSRSGLIVRGHGRLLAGLKAGFTEVPVEVQHYETEAEEIADLIADNRIPELANMDSESLAALLVALPAEQALLTGYSQSEAAALLNAAKEPPPPTAPPGTENLADLPATALAEPGCVYAVGRHRIACGDSRSPALMAALCGSDRAGLLVMDPPYGVQFRRSQFIRDQSHIALRSMTHEQLTTIANDSRENVDQMFFIRDLLSAAKAFMLPGSGAYMFTGSMKEAAWSMLGFIESGLTAQSVIACVKNHFAIGQCDYHWKHENCIYGWLKPGPRRWFGGRDKSSVIEYTRLSRTAHPNEKPVELLLHFIRNSSQDNDVVLDPCAGSGAVMAACEQSGRTCLCSDIEPKWVHYAVRRLCGMVGGEESAVLENPLAQFDIEAMEGYVMAEAGTVEEA